MAADPIVTKILEEIGPLLDVEYDYLEGDFGQIETPLGEKIRSIVDKYKLVKIGKSSEPAHRFKTEYKPLGYSKLIVVYKSEKMKDIEDAEAAFLDDYIDDLMVLNINKGSAGGLGDSPHYLYIAIAPELVTSGLFTAYQKKVDSVMKKMKNQLAELAGKAETIQ